jgi:hypothetical protein
MPNHCESDLTVTGPDAAIEEFLARFCKNDAPDLNAIRPYPQRFLDLDAAAEEWTDGLKVLRERVKPTDDEWKAIYEEYVSTRGPWPKDGFNSGGYEWCIQNWGTKWGCYSGLMDDRLPGEPLVLHFETAWSPFNIDLLQIVSAALPSLTFQYDSYERGAAYQSHATVEGGEVREAATAEYRGNRGG